MVSLVVKNSGLPIDVEGYLDENAPHLPNPVREAMALIAPEAFYQDDLEGNAQRVEEILSFLDMAERFAYDYFPNQKLGITDAAYFVLAAAEEVEFNEAYDEFLDADQLYLLDQVRRLRTDFDLLNDETEQFSQLAVFIALTKIYDAVDVLYMDLLNGETDPKNFKEDAAAQVMLKALKTHLDPSRSIMENAIFKRVRDIEYVERYHSSPEFWFVNVVSEENFTSLSIEDLAQNIMGSSHHLVKRALELGIDGISDGLNVKDYKTSFAYFALEDLLPARLLIEYYPHEDPSIIAFAILHNGLIDPDIRAEMSKRFGLEAEEIMYFYDSLEQSQQLAMLDPSDQRVLSDFVVISQQCNMMRAVQELELLNDNDPDFGAALDHARGEFDGLFALIKHDKICHPGLQRSVVKTYRMANELIAQKIGIHQGPLAAANDVQSRDTMCTVEDIRWNPTGSIGQEDIKASMADVTIAHDVPDIS